MPLDDLLAIPGNRSVFDDAHALLDQRNAIAFVGAGASAGMYPLWNQFIDRLADYALVRGTARPSDVERWKADQSSPPQHRVDAILLKLEDREYRHFLKETFKPAPGEFTPIHAALLRLPFRGYVTTNYDPALDFARTKLRPHTRTSGTPTWEDEKEVYRWLNGDVFQDDCPILWLHGFWQRPAGIVLNADEYAQAYRASLYRSTFKRLWLQDHLAFVGFGFNDPQFTFMVGEMLQEIAGVEALPRHMAILSIPAAVDEGTIVERRAMLEKRYHVRPLFYPVTSRADGGEDHSELLALLEHFAISHADTFAEPLPRRPPPRKSSFVETWIHEPTNDDKFTGREDQIERLDRWVRDAAVRAVGVTAVGGTGKTALVGKWLKTTMGWRSRPFKGLFAWSFYQSRDVAELLNAFGKWARNELRIDASPFDVMRKQPIVLVLDGLEVLQEGPADLRHGAFLDGSLRELLVTICSREHQSLAVLTSRYVFADLERFLGTAFHQLELPGLTGPQGATLLGELNVGGSVDERVGVSDQLDGHPLALRVFADALPAGQREQPRAFLDQAFRVDGMRNKTSLELKVGRLLAFYQEKLPPTQVRLLSVIALFRSPVAEETILRLVRGLFPEDDVELEAELRRLEDRGGIVTREPMDGGHGYASHPILRDHFRKVLVDDGWGTMAADLLRGDPSGTRPRSVKEIERVLLAIELLLDARAFVDADKLYRDRLDTGRVFFSIPAPYEGMISTLAFVKDPERRAECEKHISRPNVALYLNGVGAFANYVGQSETALDYYSEAAQIYRETNNAKNLGIVLRNEVRALADVGRIGDAMLRANESLELETRRRGKDAANLKHAYVYRGFASTVSGNVKAAIEDFAIANALEGSGGLYSLRGAMWTELLAAAGQIAAAKTRAERNRVICDTNRWTDDLALCHHVLATCALAQGLLVIAADELAAAETIFRRAHMLRNLARLHVTGGMIALARGDAAGAYMRAAEALTLAQPRALRLVHADALVLRGRSRMLEGNDAVSIALDDAEDALRIARSCGYPWGERDALLLRADAYAALGRDDGMSRTDAEKISARLVLTDADVAAADRNAFAWMQTWQKSMTFVEEQPKRLPARKPVRKDRRRRRRR